MAVETLTKMETMAVVSLGAVVLEGRVGPVVVEGDLIVGDQQQFSLYGRFEVEQVGLFEPPLQRILTHAHPLFQVEHAQCSLTLLLNHHPQEEK